MPEHNLMLADRVMTSSCQMRFEPDVSQWNCLRRGC